MLCVFSRMLCVFSMQNTSAGQHAEMLSWWTRITGFFLGAARHILRRPHRNSSWIQNRAWLWQGMSLPWMSAWHRAWTMLWRSWSVSRARWWEFAAKATETFVKALWYNKFSPIPLTLPLIFFGLRLPTKSLFILLSMVDCDSTTS